MSAAPLMYTVPGAARVARVPKSEISRAIREGHLAATEIKPLVFRVSPSALTAWMRGSRRAGANTPTAPVPPEYVACLTLRAFLNRHRLSAYRVAAAGRGRVSRNAVYALARGEADRIDLGTLAKLAGVLEQLTGEPVDVTDLLILDRLPDAYPQEEQS